MTSVTTTSWAAFNQGHNLHALATTIAGRFTFLVVTPPLSVNGNHIARACNGASYDTSNGLNAYAHIAQRLLLFDGDAHWIGNLAVHCGGASMPQLLFAGTLDHSPATFVTISDCH